MQRDNGKNEAVHVQPRTYTIQEMQQHTQEVNLRQSVQELEQQTTDLRHNTEDVDILTQHVHKTLFAQQKKEAAKQTVAQRLAERV